MEPDGRFNRWSLGSRVVQHFSEPACGFAIRSQQPGRAPIASALQPPPQRVGQLAAFHFADDQMPGDYAALFPKIWRSFILPDMGLRLSCEAFSPVVAGDLDSASLPLALFRWQIENISDAPRDVALLGHWANMLGRFQTHEDRRSGGNSAGRSNRAYDDGDHFGVLFESAALDDPIAPGHGQWALLTRCDPSLRLGRVVMFDGLGDGADLWNDFLTTGRIGPDDRQWLADCGFSTDETGLPTAAISAGCNLAPGAQCQIDMALVWDQPAMCYALGDRHWRAYSDQWGRAGKAAAAIGAYGLKHQVCWSSAIDDWHGQIEQTLGPAPHQAGFALNELYLLVDGATHHATADRIPDDETGDKGGGKHFGLLECPDYPYYNTLDLYGYAGPALAACFPGLDHRVIEDYAATVALDDPRMRKAMNSDARFRIKKSGFLPHDMGAPGEAPFRILNGYALADSTRWKDLNSQFVLAVWRVGLRADDDFLRAQFPAVAMAIDHLAVFDRDGDGLIEHEGFPDQTFDNLPCWGRAAIAGGCGLRPSAPVCGSLPLRGKRRERRIGRAFWKRDARPLNACYGPAAIIALIAMDYRDALFLEQLFGPFLARKYGLGDIVPVDHARTALMHLYQHNFIEAGDGIGPVLLSGLPVEDKTGDHGDPDVQRHEVITGIAMSFAAQCRTYG
ncbi:GH116 family glycosyl-hydrolase [Iodidimonas nitroreducens]|nr:GH116 family glycosyl-hydrolase [Iodidimonas nitroreducens]